MAVFVAKLGVPRAAALSNHRFGVVLLAEAGALCCRGDSS